jgi:hypothetical protein
MSGWTGDDGRETRRKLFLKRVREGGEEKRWRDRGGDEEIMRCLWVAEKRRRDEMTQREAMGIKEPSEEDEQERMVNLGMSDSLQEYAGLLMVARRDYG